MKINDNIAPLAPIGRSPAVLQILPSLVSGGAERGAIELAAALVEAGWVSYVASSGGPLEREVVRAGATHLTLPLASKNPFVMRRNKRALELLIRRFGVDIDKLRSALQMSSADNHALGNWGNQTMAWAEDDMKIVAEMAARAGIALPQAGVNREVCRALKPRRYRLSDYGI